MGVPPQSPQPAPEVLLRGYALVSRFYPAAAVVLATSLLAHAGEHLVIAAIGLLLGSSALPQIFDAGMARRMTMEAALQGEASARDRSMAILAAQYIWFSFILAVPALAYAFLAQSRQSFETPGLLLSITLACLTAPISVLVSAALYGWRRCSSQQMAASLLLDGLLLAVIVLVTLAFPRWAPATLAAGLLCRQLLLCQVFGVTRIVWDALIDPARAVRNLLGTLGEHGRAELRLGLYCIAAWGLDPFLYVYIQAPGDSAIHLIATRVAQAAISVFNVVLIASLWRPSARTQTASADRPNPTLGWGILAATGVLAAALWWRSDHQGARALDAWVIVGAVTLGTLVAMLRQNQTIAFMRTRCDVREGAHYMDLALILALKLFAVWQSDVVALELASVAASGLYLLRLQRVQHETEVKP